MVDAWLPELLLFEDSDGNWGEYIELLHEKFLDDFHRSPPTWPGKRVGLKRHPEYAGKSATFWHMISEGSTEADRTPDLRRCERIPWPRPLIGEFDDMPAGTGRSRIIWWKESRGKEERYLLALSDFSYVVVVVDRGDYVLPWTAFTVEYTNRREKFRKVYEAFWSVRKAEAAPKDGLVTPSTHG